MRWFRTFIISLALHALLAMLLSRVPSTIVPPPSDSTFIELLETPPEVARSADPERDRQIVRSTELPPELLAKEKRDRPARFLSENDQTVLEEQKARASGLTANRNGDAPPTNEPGAASAKPQADHQPKAETRRKPLDLNPRNPLEQAAEKLAERPLDGEGDVPVGGLARPKPSAKDGSRELALPGPGLSGSGASTLGEQLPPDIKFGNFTALNTDRYLYYSFYARVEELVRHRWVRLVRGVLYGYQNSPRSQSGQSNWSTRIEIVLDKAGNFKRGILHDSSGLQGLDIAPVQAFREAKQVPNPPQEMVKEDGTIRLMYEFNVNFVPQYAADR